MKTSDIRLGKKYMLSLGRRGAVAVTVVAFDGVSKKYRCWREGGSAYLAGARRLSPCEVTDREGKLIGYAHEM